MKGIVGKKYVYIFIYFSYLQTWIAFVIILFTLKQKSYDYLVNLIIYYTHTQIYTYSHAYIYIYREIGGREKGGRAEKERAGVQRKCLQLN